MAWRYHGRARVDPNAPEAFAVCDFCGFLYNLIDLNWNYQWMGPRLQNTQFLVCDRCNDVPQEQLRTIVLPPDPTPIRNARPENYTIDDLTFRITQDGDRRVTMDGIPRTITTSGNG